MASTFCSIITSIDVGFLMGVGNDLAYKCSKDLKTFSKLTRKADMIVMGRKTWDSLPTKPLPGRKNVIISKSLEIISNISDKSTADVKVYKSLEDLFENESGHLCFIGGAKIFHLLYTNYPHYIDLIRITKFESAMTLEEKKSEKYENNLVYFPKELLQNFTIINKETYTDKVKVAYSLNEEEVEMTIEYMEYMPISKNRMDLVPSEVAYLQLMRNLLQCPLRDTRNGKVRSLFSNKLKYDCRDGKIPF